MQNLEFVCNCCADHCTGLTTALAQAKPGLALNSGFDPKIDGDQCTVCDVCIDSCPATALTMSEDDVPVANMDRCFGCGVCATLCPTEAITLVGKPGYPAPAVNQAALEEALRAEAPSS